TLSNYQQSPRKVRLVADLVRGKGVAEALAALSFLEKRASGPFAKALRSAAANAKGAGKDVSRLFVAAVDVDKGTVSRRYLPRARGSASPINKRSSHISITLGEK